jgi:hypothetical protein
MSLKGKGLQIGMLEVVENKGAVCDWNARGCAWQVARGGSGAGWSGQTQLSIAQYLLNVK